MKWRCFEVLTVMKNLLSMQRHSDMTMKKSRKSLDLGNSVESPSSVCKFCSRAFRSEKTLAAHVCEKKRRNMMKDEKYVQMGFRAFQRFYEMTDQSTKQKTWEDFVKNKFYISFTKFGKFCYDMQVVMFAEYTDFVIKNGLKIEIKWMQVLKR